MTADNFKDLASSIKSLRNVAHLMDVTNERNGILPSLRKEEDGAARVDFGGVAFCAENRAGGSVLLSLREIGFQTAGEEVGQS